MRKAYYFISYTPYVGVVCSTPHSLTNVTSSFSIERIHGEKSNNNDKYERKERKMIKNSTLV